MTLSSTYSPFPSLFSRGYDLIHGMKRWHFFLLAGLYLLLVRLQGIDFNDEGFHLAFYQQLFRDPESVQYGFWMWLTGIIAGGFMKLFPWTGMLGIRILGALFTLGTLMLAYSLLRRFLQEGVLRISMLLLLLFINEDAKNLYYNNLSAFFYFLVAYALFTGVTENTGWKITFAGFIAGINVFSRIPNILGLGMIAVLLAWGIIYHKPFKQIAKNSLLFVAGFALAIAAVWALMKALGHFNYFIESVKMVFASSRDAGKQDGTGGAYGLFRMLTRNLSDYVSALRAVILFSVLLLLTGLAMSLFSRWRKLPGGIVMLLPFLLAAGLIYLVWQGYGTSYRLLMLFTGISLMSLLVLFSKKSSPSLKLLTVTGALIFLIHPFGSSEGISTVVVYSLWISFPLSLHALFSWQRPFGLSATGIGQQIPWRTDYTPALRFIFIFSIALACLFNVVRFPYLCDRHARSEMTAQIDHPLARGLFTSPARAKAIEELLNAGKKYAPPGSVVLGYDCLPLYHYLSETRSYVRNPCIWFYSNSLFEEELNRAQTRFTALPVVVKQNIHTTGAGSAWPDSTPAFPYEQLERNQTKNALLARFLNQNQYTEVWSNGSFSILLPANHKNVNTP